MVHTVFVVGAGASQETGLPFGKDFRDAIAQRLDIVIEPVRGLTSGDRVIAEAIGRHCRQTPGARDEQYFAACRRIARAMTQAQSIDRFIDNHSGDELIAICGKLAIIRTILEAERRTKMFVDAPTDRAFGFKALESTWYRRFWLLLIDRCRSTADLAKRLESVCLVVFNYDRCIEQFLFYSLQNYFDLTETQSAEILRHLTIYHVYGSVGALPWQRNGAVAYGAEPQAGHLMRYAAGIRTFTEKVESPDVANIRSAVADAARVVFLGFSFDDDNVALLSPEAEMPIGKRTRMYATAYGISDSDCVQIVNQLMRMKRHASIVDPPAYYHVNNKLKCAGLFDEYWKSLSLSGD